MKSKQRKMTNEEIEIADKLDKAKNLLREVWDWDGLSRKETSKIDTILFKIESFATTSGLVLGDKERTALAA